MAENTKEKAWEESVKRFASVYKKAEELGIDPQIVDELVVEVFKIEIINKRVSKKEA